MQRQLVSLPTLALCALLLPMGCDSGEAEKKTDAKPAAPEKKAPAPKPDDGAKAKGDAQDAEVAALKAEAAAAKEALDAAKAENKELQAELDAPPEPEDDVGAEKELEKGKLVVMAAFGACSINGTPLLRASLMAR